MNSSWYVKQALISIRLVYRCAFFSASVMSASTDAEKRQGVESYGGEAQAEPGKKKNHNRIFTTCLSTQQQQKYFGTGMQNQQRRAYIYKIILGRRRRHKSLTCSSRRSKTSSRNISSAQTRRQIVGGKADYRLSKWWAANRQGQSSPAVPSQALQHPLFSFTLRARGWRLKASPL